MNNSNASRGTGQPVHRDSSPVGSVEAELWTPTDEAAKARALEAARRYELAHKRKGRRNGPLGHVGLEVLEALWNVVDFSTGRLEPSLTWLMEKTGRCRDAVVCALKRLARCGFVKWARRFVYVPGLVAYARTIGRRDVPPVKQATNAYGLAVPSDAAALVPERKDRRTTARGVMELEVMAALQRRKLAYTAASLPYRGDHYRDPYDFRAANKSFRDNNLAFANCESVTPEETRSMDSKKEAGTPVAS